MAEIVPLMVGVLAACSVWGMASAVCAPYGALASGAAGAWDAEVARVQLAARVVALARAAGAHVPVMPRGEGALDAWAAEAARVARPLVGAAADERVCARGLLALGVSWRCRGWRGDCPVAPWCARWRGGSGGVLCRSCGKALSRAGASRGVRYARGIPGACHLAWVRPFAGAGPEVCGRSCAGTRANGVLACGVCPHVRSSRT